MAWILTEKGLTLVLDYDLSDLSPTFSGITITGLTANRLVASDGTDALVSTDLSSWVAGTTNQVSVADDSDGTITLSLPQDIHTGASPTFTNLALTGYLDVGEIAEPDTPAADTIRLYAEDASGFSALKAKLSDGFVGELLRDSLLTVRNTSGASIDKGKAVYMTGSTGVTPEVALAKADAEATMPAIGITVETIADNAFGRVISLGDLKNLSVFPTASFSDGDTLWISAATAGAMASSKPAHPNLVQEVGHVISASDGGAGIMHVRVGSFNHHETGTSEELFEIGASSTGELGAGSVNRPSGEFTLEIGGVAELGVSEDQIDGKGSELTNIADPTTAAGVGDRLYNDERYQKPWTQSQGLAVTAASSGSSGIAIADNAAIEFATYDFAGLIGVRLADYTPAAEQILEQKHDGSNGREFSLQTSGVLRLTINGTDYDSTVATGLTNDTAHLLGYSVTREASGAAGEVIFTVDGAQLGDAVAITAGAPTTVNNAVSQYVMGTSTTRTAGVVYFFVAFNYALTVAEHLSLYRNGVAEADKWGGEVFYESDFSAGADGFLGSGGAVAGNIDTDADGAGQPPSDDWLRLTVDAADSAHLAYNTSAASANKPQRVSGQFFVPAGQSNVDGIYVGYNDGEAQREFFSATGAATDFSTGTITPANNVLTLGAADGEAYSFQDAGGDDVAYFKDIAVTLAGAVLALEPEGILEERWLDSSSNGLDATYPSAGVSLVRSMGNIKSNSFIWSTIMGG